MKAVLIAVAKGLVFVVALAVIMAFAVFVYYVDIVARAGPNW